ncbi:hypothetical protein F11_10930 [Rhodospirillum rubrum F11]|nr:hypothetical protein F11_10930 [Rhodospirillum rubrum F11]
MIGPMVGGQGPVVKGKGGESRVGLAEGGGDVALLGALFFLG